MNKTGDNGTGQLMAFDEAADKNVEPPDAVTPAGEPEALSLGSLSALNGGYLTDALAKAKNAVSGTMGKLGSVDFAMVWDTHHMEYLPTRWL